jgi:hypothetical protein
MFEWVSVQQVYTFVVLSHFATLSLCCFVACHTQVVSL